MYIQIQKILQKFKKKRKEDNSNMSSFFYSQQITYCECIMPREIGWQAINQLGQLQCIHFQNKQINYDNPYSKSLKRCQQALGKLSDVKNFIQEIKPKKQQKEQPKSYKELLKQFKKQIEKQKIHGYLYINQIEDQIKNIHDYLSRQKKQLEGLEKDLHQKIIDLALFITLLNQEEFKVISLQKNLLENSSLFDYKCVIINRKDLLQIQKGLFRISRGHAWLKSFNIDPQRMNLNFLSKSVSLSQHFQPSYQFLADKIVCIIIFQFGQNNTLLNKINRYLSCMDITTTTSQINKWQSQVTQLQKKIKQIENIKLLTNDAIQRYLYRLYEPYGNTGVGLLDYLQAYALKQCQIYRKLASTKQSKSFLHFNIYVPTKSLPLKLNLPEKLPPLTLTPKSTHAAPPTKYPTSTILQIPQQILNTYGIPSYSQFNPAPLYIVTFAFFIGIMFGDLGHMLMAIPCLIYFKVNVWAWVVVFFMGYCGLIYGQFLGLAVGIWSSCYEFPAFIAGQYTAKAPRIEDCVYPFGMDPIWKVAENDMQYTNSFKMKFAVIIGVAQMLLGICLKIHNKIRNKKYLQLITVAIPQLIFMLCTFFYMDFLIIYKWGSNYSGQNSRNAPSIIATMISVYAGFGDAPYLFWQGQRKFEKVIVMLGYLMIPIMLLGIPVITWFRRRAQKKLLMSTNQEHQEFNDLMDQKVPQSDSGGSSQQGISQRHRNNTHSNESIVKKHDEQDMSQIVVHSFIQTIQYILGTVSNTASYLRLWALSLAHGQLSQVIFDLTLQPSISGGYSRIVAAFFAFIFYYSVTFGVLICMDSMQCFLHALRLHWVEFQNKFYQGKGYKFQAFSFKKIGQFGQNNNK